MSDPIHVRAAAVLSVGLMAFAQGAQAECSREDVQFYLDRGFTAEQVTQLCSPAQQEQPDRKYRAYTDEYIDREDAEYRARLRTEREVSLRSSIAAVGIALRGGHLYYTRKVCVSEGVEKDRAFGLKACPDIRYRIQLAGLQIDPKRHKRRFLFGDPLIEVHGDIRREEQPGAFAEIPDQYWRDTLRAKLESGDTTRIPLRPGVDFQFVRESLQEIVDFETDRATARETAETGDSTGLDQLATELQ